MSNFFIQNIIVGISIRPEFVSLWSKCIFVAFKKFLSSKMLKKYLLLHNLY